MDPRRARLLRSALPLALSALAAGCAGAPPKMSFSEAGFASASPALPAAAGSAAEEPETAAPAPVRVAAPEAEPTEVPQGPPIDPVLQRFAAEARARRASGGRAHAGAAFPPEAEAAWRALLGPVDGWLARPLPQTPLLELVRVRVTLEAEWSADADRFGAAPGELREAVAARLARVARRQDAARALGLGLAAAPPPGRLRWPVEGGISSPFGMRVDPIDGTRRMHQGLDLAADQGRVVRAAARGWVVRAGYVGGHGLMVELRHDGDLTTRYSHLSAVLCAPGDPVEAGGPLGLVGHSGRATGPHLHFEVWEGGAPTDPLALLTSPGADHVAAAR